MDTVRRRSAGGIILIAVGLFFLVANVANAQGWGWLLGLGLALLVASFLGDWYGLVVAGCMLTALGLSGLIDRSHWLVLDRGPVFLVVLGLGFIAIYPLGRRWHLWWPLIPGVVLLWIGAVPPIIAQLGWLTIQQWAALTYWWPVLLVVVGLWVILRPVLPARSERVARVAMVALVAIICLFLLTGLAASLALEPAQATYYWGFPRRWR
ncbi:MAG: hypothetical protein M1389_11940 [Chloroflexi bacterium]|nr:hypothetical protein [Chloroflexota bacterium]